MGVAFINRRLGNKQHWNERVFKCRVWPLESSKRNSREYFGCPEPRM